MPQETAVAEPSVEKKEEPVKAAEPKAEVKVQTADVPHETKAENENVSPAPVKEAEKETKAAVEEKPTAPETTGKAEEPKEDKAGKAKSGGFLSSLFKKKEKPAEEPKEDKADDALAAAFEKPAEEPKEDKVDDALAAAFEKPVEEPKEDKAGDALAAAFNKPAEEPKKDNAPEVGNILADAYREIEREQKTLSSKDLLTQAIKSKPKTTAEVLNSALKNKDGADDALAKAFENSSEDQHKTKNQDALAAAFGELAEEPKKDSSPEIGNILADAYREIEREQKTISSKDLLAQAIKSKPQTTAELLNSTLKNSDAEVSTDDNNVDEELTKAFENPAKKNQNSDFEALIKAFKS